ncbi:hypothetical protein O181_004214 [Austropuccinia psidii MF-1]|uniref:Ataxin-10 homolog n=1 Tax=Austropuccinia psidii MF-1 TaxID=1389203 RepID=A0A9Q3GEM3_9BASI|nr:hypothetical protein [Austropuccinia psidii MF-1]
MIEQEDLRLISRFDFDQIDVDSLERFISHVNGDCSLRQEFPRKHPQAISDWLNHGWKFIAERFRDGSGESIVKFSTTWARLSRDTVGGMNSLQDSCRPAIDHLIQILWFTSAIARLDHDDFRDLNRYGIQALSNLVTSNPVSLEYAWDLLVNCEERQSALLRLLYTQDHRLLLTISVLVLNSVYKSPQRIQSLTQTPIGKSVMTMLLERLDSLLDDVDVVFEVVVNLIRQIIDIDPNSQIPLLYESQATPSQKLSPAQLSILKVLDCSTLPCSAFLVDKFLKFTKSLEDCWQGFVLVADMLIHQLEKMQGACDEKIFRLDDNESKEVVTISIQILQGLSTDDTSSEKGQDSQNQQRKNTQIKISLVKLLTALVDFKGKSVQDLIRELNGIAIILGFTKLDDQAPYLREHSLFLIRYLLRENLENQEIVKNMRPITITKHSPV